MVDDRLGSKYPSVSVTLHLTFLKSKQFVRKLMKFFKVLAKEK